MELTKEELELIHSKRAKEEIARKKEEDKQAKENEETIEWQRKQSKAWKKAEVEYRNTVEDFFKRLKAISPDYRLEKSSHTKEFKATRFVGFGEPSVHLETFEVECIRYKIYYTGDKVKGSTYYITPAFSIINNSDYRLDRASCKLDKEKYHIKGSDRTWTEENRKYSSVKGIHSKILECVDYTKAKVRQNSWRDRLNENAKYQLEQMFPEAEIKIESERRRHSYTTYYYGMVVFDNGNTLKVSFEGKWDSVKDERSDKAELSFRSVDLKTSGNLEDIGEWLSKL